MHVPPPASFAVGSGPKMLNIMKSRRSEHTSENRDRSLQWRELILGVWVAHETPESHTVRAFIDGVLDHGAHKRSGKSFILEKSAVLRDGALRPYEDTAYAKPKGKFSLLGDITSEQLERTRMANEVCVDFTYGKNGVSACLYETHMCMR